MREGEKFGVTAHPLNVGIPQVSVPYPLLWPCDTYLRCVRITLLFPDAPTGLKGLTWPEMMTLLFTLFSLNIISSYKLVGIQKIRVELWEEREIVSQGGKTHNTCPSAWHTHDLYRMSSPHIPFFLTAIPPPLPP